MSAPIMDDPAGVTGCDRRSYPVFGGVLRSQLDFPELAPIAAASPDWDLSIEAAPPPPIELERLGERQIGPERYSLSRTARGFRLEYSHAGTFDVSTVSAAITWYRVDDARPELVRAIVLGPILALLLEAHGMLCLHGSAVVVGDGAIAFVGPKFHGKSTVAAALTRAGARLISDDLVAVRPATPPMVLPGVPSMRLWSDTTEKLDVGRFFETVIPGIKTTVGGLAAGAIAESVKPLRAVYMMEPVRPADASAAAARIRLSGAAAAVALAQQSKLPDGLIGLSAAGDKLRTAAALAAVVPVFRLRIARDFSHLSDVVDAILGWHESGPA